MATKSISELREIASKHASEVQTYTDFVRQVHSFSQEIGYPELHVFSEGALEEFSLASFKKKKSLGKANSRQLRKTHNVPDWIKDYTDPVCPRVLEAVNKIVQEEIRKNKNKLDESSIHALAAYKNLFFSKVKEKVSSNPPS
jgi:hypothetical protein